MIQIYKLFSYSILCTNYSLKFRATSYGGTNEVSFVLLQYHSCMRRNFRAHNQIPKSPSDLHLCNTLSTMLLISFTSWSFYTGLVNRIILTFCRITSPFSYYITLIPCDLIVFVLSSYFFAVLPHPFAIIFTVLTVLPYPFAIIFTLIPYYLTLLLLFSHFLPYYFTLFAIFTL